MVAESNKRTKKVKTEVYPSCPYPRLILDESKYKLGHLCPSKHDFGDGQSMRLVSNNQCFECRKKPYPVKDRKEYLEAYRKANPEKAREGTRRYRERNPNQGKEYYQRNREKVLARTKYNKDANREKVRQQSRMHYEVNREKRLQQIKVYSLTPAGKAKARRYKNKRKALKLLNHHYPWTNEQGEQRLNDFSRSCAYCGSTERLAFDHFIPLSRGGADCIGNIVIACQSCNSSKNASDPKEWYQKHRSYSVKRWKHILKVLGLKDHNYNQLPLF